MRGGRSGGDCFAQGGERGRVDGRMRGRGCVIVGFVVVVRIDGRFVGRGSGV